MLEYICNSKGANNACGNDAYYVTGYIFGNLFS
jgi:hypothetical protein